MAFVDHAPAHSLSSHDQLFAGGGELGRFMRETDWSKSPLGPAESWPQALKTCIRIILTSRQPMFVWWGDRLINLYNDAYRAILGGKHPHALGQPAHLVWQEIWDQVGPRARSAMEENEGTYDEALLLIMERNGYPEETYYTFSYSPVPNDDGRPGGIICANTDDTQRIIGERQLALLRELATKTADARSIRDACLFSAQGLESNSHDIPFALIYLVSPPDPQQLVLAGKSGFSDTATPAPEEISLNSSSSYPFADTVKDQTAHLLADIHTFLGAAPLGAWQKPPTQALVLPIAPSGETGRHGVLVVGLNPFRILDDGYRGFLNLVSNHIAAAIAHAQAYEEERKRAEALAEIDRAKTVFFSNVSHEFRTPLTLMLGPLEDGLAMSKTSGLPEIHSLLDVAHRNGLRLLRLVNTLLDFSRIEAGRVSAHYEPTDLCQLTLDLASTFRSVIEKAGLRLTCDCTLRSELVFVDRDLWEKIVLNLVSNAFKFTFEGEIRVELRPSADGSWAELVVADTGTGIPRDEIPRLFERFHRVEGARGRTYEGTGIGLALVQELVKLHGGTISVESELGRGSSFIVRIPFGQSHLPSDRIGNKSLPSRESRAEAFVEEASRWLSHTLEPSSVPDVIPSADSIGGTVPATSRGKILLADDNADMREYVSRLLGAHHEIIAVANGQEALEYARKSPPELVLTDVMMPMLDGFGLLRELRAHHRTGSIPVLLLSARAGEEAQVEGLEAGADDYLVKPFTARELLARVNTHLAMSRLRRETAERERELRAQAEESREQVIDILESMPDGFISLDSDWRFVYVNRAAEQINGMSRDQLLGRSHWEVFPSTRETELERSFYRVAAEQKPIQIENYYEPWQRWFELRVYPNAHGISIFFTDITERKTAETAIHASNQALRRANSDLEQFAFSASHDLQEPLRMVAIYSQLLQKKYRGRLDDQADMIIRQCVNGAVRMEQLIKDLLEYTRASAPATSAPELTDVGPVLQQALENLQAAIQETGAVITHDVLPAVRVEAIHLQQILQNLVGNALKYRSEKRPEIHISAERQKNNYLFSIRDNGIGIDPSYREQVFGLFKRLHSGAQYSGTGLGLAICRKIVERYGGRIWVESELGSGSTFFFALPVTEQ